MARNYNIKGTKSFLIAAVILFVLALWFIADGWFPSERVLERHPDLTDTFYAFNKTTGVLMMIASVVCAYIHFLVH